MEQASFSLWNFLYLDIATVLRVSHSPQALKGLRLGSKQWTEKVQAIWSVSSGCWCVGMKPGRCGFEFWLWHMSEMGLWAVHFTFVILRFLIYTIRKIILPTSLELNVRIKDVSGVEYVAWHTVDIVQMSTTIITIWKDKYLLCGFRPVSWLVWVCFFFFSGDTSLNIAFHLCVHD